MIQGRRTHAHLPSLVLGPRRVSSSELEERLAPTYATLRLPKGQLAALTGIQERRWWPEGTALEGVAIEAARQALAAADLPPSALGAVIYGGVGKDRHEPAMACAIAEALGARGAVATFDVANACLGVVTALLQAAAWIELGVIRAAVVVGAETAGPINEATLAELNARPEAARFWGAFATFTGGSGASAIVLTDGKVGAPPPLKLRSAVLHSAPEHHGLCTWGMRPVGPGPAGQVWHEEHMHTDAAGILRHGVPLAEATWARFWPSTGWALAELGLVCCHQVGAANQAGVLKALALDPSLDHPTYAKWGNMGSVSLPATVHDAQAQGRLLPGTKLAWLGIGSGLSCAMLAWEA